MTAVLCFLAVALLFYVLFAGADFGAGILEIFAGHDSDQRSLISRAIAPVWEANHVWLILALVILFVGFPSIYTTLSIHLHLPLMAALVGIVGRGCAFTFRHYDTLSDTYAPLYTRIFSGASVWSAFFLGVVAGALTLGRIDPRATTYAGLYVDPWLNPFCCALGIFACGLFAFLAAVYLVGEAQTPLLQRRMRGRAVVAAVVMVASGASVFVTAPALLSVFFHDPFAIAAFVGATGGVIAFWRVLGKTSTLWPRVLAMAIVTLVLFGWFSMQYPFALRFTVGGLTFADAAAPQVTLDAMLGALIVGALLIFPALGYLLAIFKAETVIVRRAS